MKPRLFVASSSESLDIAYSIQTNLEKDCEVTVWAQGIFQPTITSLESLLHSIKNFDFGVFIFSPDDLLRIRGAEHIAVRDNVLFELGLFIGRLGRERVFVIMPRDNHDFRVPSDLIGLSPLTFDSSRSDQNYCAALGSACYQMRKTIDGLGIFTTTPEQYLRDLVSRSQVHFHLINQKTSKALDVTDWKVNEGGQIQQWLYHAGGNQLWSVRAIDDSYFVIESKHSGKCLSVENASKSELAPIIQQEYKGRNCQKWQMIPANGGSYRIIAKHSEQCLEILDASEDNGAAVVQNKFVGSEHQMWWVNIHVPALRY
jgi:Predicted nucleotide-binding protein containing TIR-like domain/Ricin-type beta-trefoil lectin domain-like